MSYVEVKYFGVLVERTGKVSERIPLDKIGSLADVIAYFETSYAVEKSQKYQVALNKKIAKDGELSTGDEIAFLPPFAGG